MQKEWAEIGKDSFNFALLACKKFKDTEDPNEKKLIARTVGSKLILLYQELLFQPRFLFLKYKEGIERTKVEIKRLAPYNSLSNQANLENFVKSSIWYPQRKYHRTAFGLDIQINECVLV